MDSAAAQAEIQSLFAATKRVQLPMRQPLPDSPKENSANYTFSRIS